MSARAGRGCSDAYARIYALVRKIPAGRVATYGQIAELAGLAGHARQVGYALHATPDHGEVPWQRVVNARGEISRRVDPTLEGLQQSLLEAEGVSFDAQGRIDLGLSRWQPRLYSAPAKKSARSRKREKERQP